MLEKHYFGIEGADEDVWDAVNFQDLDASGVIGQLLPEGIRSLKDTATRHGYNLHVRASLFSKSNHNERTCGARRS